MSKATVKKILMSMPKEEIIGMVLEMYDARKEAKEYIEFLQIQTKMVNWKSIRRLSQKSFIHQEEDRNQRPDSLFAVRQSQTTKN